MNEAQLFVLAILHCTINQFVLRVVLPVLMKKIRQIILTMIFLIIILIILNIHKSVRWSVVPVPCPSRLCLKLNGKQGSGPEGIDNLCFHTYGEFSPPPSPPSAPPQLRGPNSSPKIQIPVSWPKSYPKGSNPSLKAQILAWRLKSQP